MGLDLASDDTTSCTVSDRTSLLDWDIILIRPELSLYYDSNYLGKPSLDESASFSIKESCEHWREAIRDAALSGRSVFVFLSDLQEFYIDTGQRKYSGTGRNRQTTRIVESYTNYRMVPYLKSVSTLHGSTIKLEDYHREVFSGYWSDFETLSSYKVVFETNDASRAFLTRNGEKCVGALIRLKDSNGVIVCLPDIDFDCEDFIVEEEGQEVWSKNAKAFAGNLVSRVVEIDRIARMSGDNTPSPEWSTSPNFSLPKENEILQELLGVEEDISRAHRRKEELEARLEKETRIKGLLYEKGPALETAILDALKVLGFTAENYHEGASEFDAIFSFDGVRFLGEAEGKDNASINITKLRQLAMNIQEDLARDEVDLPAKGVLFGNHFRLLPLEDRAEPFTAKCIAAAEASSYALVPTADLYVAVRQFLRTDDTRIADQIRDAITSTIGVVKFDLSNEDDEEETIEGL